ncbi:discoidin domain-containing protein [Paenibacillus radicis (ex Xue et al. 2023)]|uniref:Discoidin domain-containing protein n=1 Tax=Paenibacillus radicis (ex Xue et al. 2023) TaxID=2972489 RepID=A0ABT1YM01_9BACL|nr:discoidin domain-containing protein [Paenibacillus radicis (ex Xue et al. 2023)]MCR8634179.1 discoidin domain-containing protein [Paenibacillus radicis (ex Xue et al. 2023)]
MKKKLRLLVCCLFICSLLPINFIFAAIPIDRNGNGIQIDDIVYYLSQTGGSSHSELTNLLNLIDPITPTLKVLAAPANLAATVGDSKINLTWSSVTGATYYNVYQSLDDSTYRLINAPGTITSATYEVTGLTNGILYYFKTSAAKTGAESAYSNVVGATPRTILTAGDVAAGITSVTAPFADATSLSLPTVPPGYTIAIHTSSNTEVVGINGVITPPVSPTLVDLVFRITRTSDNTTANTGTIAVVVPAHVLTAGEVAAGITSVTAPVADATSLSLPTVPPGYTIAIHTSSNTEVVGINGVITPPVSPTLVDLVFTITRTSDSTTANTGTIAVAVPAHTVLPNGGPAGYTFCGNENDTCSFTGTASVAYGANDHFNYRTFTTNTPCTNDVFGDPIGGVVKSCYYQIITTPTAGEVAAEITSVTVPAADATSLELPTVPPGYTIAIYTSSDTEVVGTNGAIKPPTAATSVNLVFTVTRTSDNTTANTGTIAVAILAHVSTERSGINVALALNGGTASSSTTISSSFTESSINNGDRWGLNWGNGGGWNDGTPDAYPDWVQIDFNGSQTIYGIDVFTIQDNFGNPSEPTTTMTFSQFGITDYTVQYWDGLTWVIVTNGNVTENNNVWKQFTFSPVVTNKIRLTITNAKSNFSRVIELEAWTQGSAA